MQEANEIATMARLMNYSLWYGYGAGIPRTTMTKVVDRRMEHRSGDILKSRKHYNTEANTLDRKGNASKIWIMDRNLSSPLTLK